MPSTDTLPTYQRQRLDLQLYALGGVALYDSERASGVVDPAESCSRYATCVREAARPARCDRGARPR